MDKIKELLKGGMKLDKLILLLAAGLLLLVLAIPSAPKDNSKEEPQTKEQSQTFAESDGQTLTNLSYEEALEKKLKEILSEVEGVGEVDVMITLKSTQELVIQSDYSKDKSFTQETDSSGGTRQITEEGESRTTVLIDNGNGEQIPYVLKELTPQISGILISAQGGGSAVVKNEIYQAVEALFDIPSHKIKVLKKQ